MKKIDLKEYKDFKQYFSFYDVIIKRVSSNKDVFLESLYLSPSSYRRAKNTGNKIGKQILNDLCKHFNYKMINDLIVDEIEEKINSIYYSVYYKNYDTYEDDLFWLESMLEKRYIIYPVLLLFKLLLLINSHIKPNNIIKNSKDIYEELQQFELFFNDDLLEIYEVIKVSFVNEINNNVLAYNYKNELSYFTLASKCILSQRYIEGIHFSEKVKNIFIREENFLRVYYANLNIMASYNLLHKYDECYALAQKQLLSLKAHKILEFEYNATLRHYLASCLGLGRYNNIINSLNEKEHLNKTEAICFLVAIYKIDKNEYTKYMDLVKSNMSQEEDNFLDLINSLLVDNNKKVISLLESMKITKSVIEILKKM